MKRYGTLAGFAFAVLVAAAVWLGGLNQDEGWYLYSARLVAEGKMPYRDFFYTQGPLLPLVYSAFAGAWETFGLLGGRVVTAAIGFLSLLFVAALARLLAPEGRKGAAGVIAFMLLGCNLYHVYYESIPKTYALASFFLMMGFYLLAFALVRERQTGEGRRVKGEGREDVKLKVKGERCRGIARGVSAVFYFAAGLTMAFAAGARISLGLALAVVGFGLLATFRRTRWAFLFFGLGGLLGLATVYGPFLLDGRAFAGLVRAQAYHAARGGFDPVFTVGSLSRLVRWYAPLFVLLGMVVFRRSRPVGLAEGTARLPMNLLLFSFLAVFAVQMLAPYPYEDYQVPVMGLLAVYTAVAIVSNAALSTPRLALLTLGMTWALAFGSPLLEAWTMNGQDRFWSLKKAKPELAQLRDVAKIVEAMDPGGQTLLTQDLYLAIETNRKVPEGLEMGPFSILTDAEWRRLLESAPCEVAALSGYTFAINPPVCDERPIGEQMAYWELLKARYDLFLKEDAFGQNATPLLLLKRKGGEGTR